MAVIIILQLTLILNFKTMDVYEFLLTWAFKPVIVIPVVVLILSLLSRSVSKDMAQATQVPKLQYTQKFGPEEDFVPPDNLDDTSFDETDLPEEVQFSDERNRNESEIGGFDEHDVDTKEEDLESEEDIANSHELLRRFAFQSQKTKEEELNEQARKQKQREESFDIKRRESQMDLQEQRLDIHDQKQSLEQYKWETQAQKEENEDILRKADLKQKEANLKEQAARKHEQALKKGWYPSGTD